MKAKQAVVIALAAAGIVGTSQAMAQAQSRLSGAYIGGSIGQAEFDKGCEGIAGSGVSCDDKDSTWKLFGGYQVNRNFAVELGYADLGEIRASGPGGTASAEANAWDLVGLGILPLGNNFSLYGKAGFYRAEVDGQVNTATFTGSADENNTDLTFGVGARYDVTRNVAVRAEWQRYSDMGGGNVGESDVDVMSLGLQYQF